MRCHSPLAVACYSVSTQWLLMSMHFPTETRKSMLDNVKLVLTGA